MGLFNRNKRPETQGPTLEDRGIKTSITKEEIIAPGHSLLEKMPAFDEKASERKLLQELGYSEEEIGTLLSRPDDSRGQEIYVSVNDRFVAGATSENLCKIDLARTRTRIILKHMAGMLTAEECFVQTAVYLLLRVAVDLNWTPASRRNVSVRKFGAHLQGILAASPEKILAMLDERAMAVFLYYYEKSGWSFYDVLMLGMEHIRLIARSRGGKRTTYGSIYSVMGETTTTNILMYLMMVVVQFGDYSFDEFLLPAE